MTGIRRMYKDGSLTKAIPQSIADRYKKIFDVVFDTYASKDSWSLSSITHGEYCWEKARNGIPENENCDRKIDTNDIRWDADRIKIRRLLYKKLMN